MIKSRVINDLATFLVPATTVTNQGDAWMRAQKGPAPAWVCSVGVSEYRSVITAVVREGDCVLELGCHLGTSTKILAGMILCMMSGV